MKYKPTTSQNTQANSVCEQLHQTISNILRTILAEIPPRNLQQAEEEMDQALLMETHVTRCAVSKSLGTSPGVLVFRRDILLDYLL